MKNVRNFGRVVKFAQRRYRLNRVHFLIHRYHGERLNPSIPEFRSGLLRKI